ncbi:hypothetical protein NSK_002733 [Nannochloropsis salina CCMP1776]|uniref:NAD(P)-binding domain-containing protein n=1 Tax=Nannochloropsis salina CCMP1776 TaxID=1027361 RepID=A0A4D9D7C0_9STRA|nr:hypothetical protein NSK_002733 [Nannochloropsis salina CCMP1776]|eukprot:TFJ85913.1 hypothetical protein NSK_002733 [Nannochloropsis salina CCMP1776]
MMAVELKVNDRVCVIGSTGGCGQLITARLVDEGRYQVRAVGRSDAKLRKVLGGESPKLEFAEADSRDIGSLYGPLSDVDCVIIATGTSAFPSPRWRGGNTPDAVDRKGVQNILKAITSKPRKRAVKKVVFLSSVGVLRTKQLPYSILNAFGVLDAKRDSEDLLRQMASTEGFDILIVRPGRLVGGPWTNTDVSTLLKVEEGARKRVVVEQGDSLVGDAARVSVAELVVRALERPEAVGRALCLVNEEGPPFSEGQWTALFEGLA